MRRWWLPGWVAAVAVLMPVLTAPPSVSDLAVSTAMLVAAWVLSPRFFPASPGDHEARRLADSTGAPVIYDATHSVQQPGLAAGGASAGDRESIPGLLFAAAGAGADGFFIETHPDPASALSDAATQWPLALLHDLVGRTLDVWHTAHATRDARRA